MLGTWLFALMAGVVAVGSIWAGVPSAGFYRDGVMWLAPSIGLAVAALIQVSLARRAHPVLLAGLHYLVFFFLLPALGQLLAGRFPFAAKPYSAALAVEAAGVVLVFVATLVAASGLAHGLRRPTQRVMVAPKPAAGAVLVLCAISVLAGLAFGYGRLNLGRGAADLGGLVISPPQLVLQSLARAAGFLAVLLAVSGLRQRRDAAWFWLCALALVVAVAANNPLALPRFVLGSYAIIAGLVLFGLARWVRIALLVVVPVVQVSIFPLLSDLARGPGVAVRWDPVGYFVGHGDFDGFQSMMNVLAMVDYSGLRYGRQLASALLFFVPGPMAPWKSPGTGADAAAFFGYRFTNVSAPLPGEFYVDFGYAGLVALTALLALAIVQADRAFQAANGTMLARLLPAMAAGYGIILFRGSLVAVMGPVACMAALGIVALWLARRSEAPDTL